MKAEEWLRLTLVIKIRNKLSAWTRDDVVAFAHQEYGSDDLSKQQVSELAEKLKAKNLEKPGKQYYPEKQVGTGAVPVEFRLVDNPGQANHPETHWYLAGNRADLRFDSTKAVTSWALDQLDGDPRMGWAERRRLWFEAHKLSKLSPEDLKEHPASPDLQKVFKRHLAENNRLKTPLPDNATLRKQYWGLAPGDRLINPEGQAEVVEVRANLDTPPTVTLRKVDT